MIVNFQISCLIQFVARFNKVIILLQEAISSSLQNTILHQYTRSITQNIDQNVSAIIYVISINSNFEISHFQRFDDYAKHSSLYSTSTVNFLDVYTNCC